MELNRTSPLGDSNIKLGQNWAFNLEAALKKIIGVYVHATVIYEIQYSDGTSDTLKHETTNFKQNNDQWLINPFHDDTRFISAYPSKTVYKSRQLSLDNKY